MKKITIIILILVAVGLILTIPGFMKKQTGKAVEEKIDSSEETTDAQPDDSEETAGTASSGAGAGSSGGSGIGGNAVSNSENPAENNATEPEDGNLPADIETRECGFYFVGYSICTGTCPSGSCVQDGRSCYCRN